tara:strand:- start:634 stop:936 length:303 start_codon:yes stop_codon:yes gene_type:complete
MFGKGIKKVRVARKLKQIELANLIGTTQDHISRLENDVHYPTRKVMDKILKALDVGLILVFWFSITEKDVLPEKVEIYNVLKPSMDEIVNNIFNSDEYIK